MQTSTGTCYAGKREAAGQPWHLLAAKILADNGHKVLMHGYHDRQSGRLHAEDYLDKFAITKAESAEDAKRVLETQNIVYLPLSAFAPQAETMIGWKNRYGLRTPINTVVRALNPGQATVGIRGSFHPGSNNFMLKSNTRLVKLRTPLCHSKDNLVSQNTTQK